MTDKPIIFSAPMVRALRDSLKTQTRRLLKPQPGDLDMAFQMSDGSWHVTDSQGGHMSPLNTRYAPGDRLWVRETWSAIMDGGWTIADARRRMFGEKIVYRADGNAYEDGDGWWPSIHMPREFSRLTLTVTDVWVQRLQEISVADAVAEGATMRHQCSGFRSMDDGWSMDWSQVGQASRWATGATRKSKAPLTEKDISLSDPQMAFASYWDRIHGPYAWDANRWVEAYTFTVDQVNIDRKGGA